MTLKPCPFCGGEPHIERRGNARFSTIISCLDCGVTHECGDTGDSVGNGWNRREAEDQMAANISAAARPADGMTLAALVEHYGAVQYSQVGQATLDFLERLSALERALTTAK